MNTDTMEWKILQGLAIPSSSNRSSTEKFAESLAQADFKAVLISDEAKRIFRKEPDLFAGLGLGDVGMIEKVNDTEEKAGSAHGNVEEDMEKLIIAIALLHAFVQANWTGPNLEFTPTDLLPKAESTESSSSTTPATIASNEDLNASALPLLTLQGEPAYHLCSHPVLLLLSIRIFDSLATPNIATLPWWRLRTHLIHLSLLDEAVPLPTETLDSLKTLLDQIPSSQQDLLTSLHLEIGMYHHSLGQDKLANQSFLEATKSAGLEYELTGAMGKKTKFQVEAVSQLVLLAESRKRSDDISNGSTVGTETTKDTEEGSSRFPESLALNDDTLLEETEFTKVTSPSDPSGSRLSHIDPSSQPPLHPLDQSILLSLCLAQANQSPESGLLASQMQPFISRVISHPRNWSVHTTALLLRSRLEAGRSRTVERATLQLSALIEQMPSTDSSLEERLRFFHQLPLPARWEMEKELAKRYMSIGVSRSALEIYTRLEMWEDVVGCLQRMDRENEAEGIVKDLLDGKKIESDLVSTFSKSSLSESRKMNLTKGRLSKLWCLLGDLALSNDEATKNPIKARDIAIGYYMKGWEVSGETSSRAMRSLGSIYFSQQDYYQTIDCLKKALAINPQFARAWFTLGVCYVRLEKWGDARDAFKREVGVDDEDGEGWNNLAAVYLRLDEEAKGDGATAKSSFDNKILAFRALRQGLRYAYNNWRMWQNYTIISIEVGELAEATRAFTRVVEELATSNPSGAVDAEILDKLVDAVTLDDWSTRDTVMPKTSNEGLGLWPLIERLFDITILSRISDNPRVWRSHARLLRWKEDWKGAIDDYIRAYRCGMVSDSSVERDLGKFREAVQEIEELVDTLTLLGPKAVAQKEKEGEGEGKKKGDWRFQARGIVRTFMGRTRESFEDQPEWEKLQEILDGLKRSD